MNIPEGGKSSCHWGSGIQLVLGVLGGCKAISFCSSPDFRVPELSREMQSADLLKTRPVASHLFQNCWFYSRWLQASWDLSACLQLARELWVSVAQGPRQQKSP